ncbi:hypothetical protein [Tenacibaculum sp. UWU-22]|uniref:hypothetical protein n=1 Tax=Tenacibaculum sp. UWU-22 TaxID=3234187 RepID=UPI0034DB13AF
MNKKYAFIIIFIFVSSMIFSQSDDNKFLDNVRFGGGLGFGFGSNNTTISLTPVAVYDFNEEFSLGASLGYMYNKSGDFKSNIYSFGLLSLYKPIYQIEFSFDLKQLFINRSFSTTKDNYSYPSLNVGAAYISQKVALGIRYDVLYKKDKSVYPNAFSPFIRVLF